MSQIEQTIVQGKIAEIIETARHGEERFFTDSKTAASNILKYLQKENIIPNYIRVN